jgi:hypothetical protein
MKQRRLILLLIVPLLIFCASPLAKYEVPARNWEADIRQFEARDRAEPDPEGAVLFIGSSSIRLWSTLREDMAPYPVIQRGFGGSKFSDVDWFAERIVYPHRFRALAVFVANDITGAPDDKTPAEVARLFRILVQTVRKKFRTEPVLFIAITPTNSRWPVWPKIREANGLIERFCGNEPGCHFIRTTDAFLKSDGTPDDALFREDRLHLNREGYRKWSGIIKKALDSVLPPAKP